MEFLESKNKFHGRLYVSNIFLFLNFWPIITDPLIHHIFKNYEEDKKNYLLRFFYVIQVNSLKIIF